MNQKIHVRENHAFYLIMRAAVSSASSSSNNSFNLSRSIPGLKPNECGIVFGRALLSLDLLGPNPDRMAWLTASLNEIPCSRDRSLGTPAKSSSSVNVVLVLNIVMLRLLMSRHQKFTYPRLTALLKRVAPTKGIKARKIAIRRAQGQTMFDSQCRQMNVRH